jgi:hypothetical protein
MLIIAGTLDVDPARRDEFLAGRADALRASQAEPGCLDYIMSADPLEPGRVRLFERWEHKDALKVHLGVLSQAKPDPDAVAVLGAEILQYEISATGPIGS